MHRLRELHGCGWFFVCRLRRNSSPCQRAELAGQDTLLLASSDLTHFGRPFGYEPFPAGERAAERLGELDRDTLVAFYVEGQSLIEMSDQFASPVGTIKRRLHVARKRLARELEDLVAV